MIHPDTPHEVHPLFANVGRTGPGSRWECIQTKCEPKDGQCWSKFCRGKRHGGRRVCWKCHMRVDRLNNPLRASFATLRTNARRRGKPFDLTLEQYRQFVEEHGYLEGRGTHVGALHIDRKDPLKGYTIDNITVLTCTENSAKGAIEDKLRHYNHQPCQPDLTLDPDYVGF
jgi:hypothetical protein